MTPTPEHPDAGLVDALSAACADTRARVSDRLAKAHDASHYLLVPSAVVVPVDTAEVSGVLSVSRARRVPVTFRSGGTSLSGQAGTDAILVDARRHFRGVEVLEQGMRLRAQPGVTMRQANARLARFGRKLGPDPASEIACTIGGVIANNSSGMSCGTHANSYRTIASMVLVLPSGTVIDTSAPDAAETLRAQEPGIVAGLERLRDRIRSDPDSVATLLRLHAIKNTMGYGLNSFLDYDEPLRILEHLVIGSEGTLAFVAEATFDTIPINPHVATGLLVFPSLREATAALPVLVEAGLTTIELMDAASLRIAQRDPEAPTGLAGLTVVEHAALLIEYQEQTEEDLSQRIEHAQGLFAVLGLSCELTRDAATRAGLWHIRKGLFTAVAGDRPSGTTSLLEDIAVPIDRLGETCERLVALFARHRYEDSVIFGHAKDGNIHFLIKERFDAPGAVDRYADFTEDLVDLVLSQGGTLKAEHGTGRIMAPYVRAQYGEELYKVMWEIKRLLDPGGLFNPGVLLNDDPHCHTKNLKPAPAVEKEVDRCVECGYCEPVCPSRDLTLTPRERIVLRRELQLARERGDGSLVRSLEDEYAYDGVQTCAVDGMCQTACPVLIDTGDLVRRLRAEAQSALAQKTWRTAARHWDAVSTVGGIALGVADALPVALPVAATRAGRALLGHDTVPLYSDDLPRGGKRRRPLRHPSPLAVYFPSCTSTMFGPVGGDGVAESFLRLCERAGVDLVTPEGIPSLCCGTPWKSKGLTEGYETMRRSVVAALRETTGDGALPVVCDASSCTEGLHVLLESAEAEGIRVLDAVAFVDEHVLARLPPAKRVRSLSLHPTCSSRRLGLDPALGRVAAAAAETVIVPENWGCCAFAGDRGMLHPELTASATDAEAREVAETASDAHASLNRTCELGMTRATRIEYQHVLQVLDHAVREGGSAAAPD